MMGNGFGMGGMWLVWLWGLLVLAGVVALVVLAVLDRADRQRAPRSGPATARAVLNERYARGDLSTEEYNERLRALVDHTG